MVIILDNNEFINKDILFNTIDTYLLFWFGLNDTFITYNCLRKNHIHFVWKFQQNHLVYFKTDVN